MARKMNMKHAAQFTFLLTVAAALTACGGGGGAVAPTQDNPGAASPAPAQTPAVVAAPVPATYAAGTEEASVFALLNQERVQCGFGALKQDARLDQSAAAHAAFLVANGISWGHGEAAGLPGYTGATEEDRAKVAGYLDPVGADLAGDVGPIVAAGTLGTTKQIRDLLAAPYHLLSLTDSAGDLGIGYAKKIVGLTETRALNLTLGFRAGVNELTADQVYSYPCEGSAGVNAGLANETPSPIPSNLAQSYKLYGAPIAVRVRTGKVLALTGATITSADGQAVQTEIVSIPNDQNGGAFLRADNAFVLPLAPLQAGTSYTVTLAGTIDGAAFRKTFSFITAN
jgi:uncharacterized protein YkwD